MAIQKNYLAIIGALISLESRAAEEIKNWQNNPNFNIVYKTKEDIRIDDLRVLIAGTRVSVSRRGVSDLLIRGPEEPKTLRLLIVGADYMDDPGVYNATIMHKDFRRVLAPTATPSANTHWHESYLSEGAEKIAKIDTNFYYMGHFVTNVFPAWKKEENRENLLLTGEIYRLIKQSPHCEESEITIRLEATQYQRDAGVDLSFYGKIRAAHPEFALVGPWYGMDYCLPINDFIREGISRYNELPLNDRGDGLIWNDSLAAKFKTFVDNYTDAKK